jgi:hypothetical protein
VQWLRVGGDGAGVKFDELIGADVEPSSFENVKRMVEEGKSLRTLQCHPAPVFLLLQYFLQNLPEPLIPFPLYDNFIVASGIDDESYLLEALRELVLSLPPANRNLALFLLSHLNEWSQTRDLMAKVAECFGPVRRSTASCLSLSSLLHCFSCS